MVSPGRNARLLCRLDAIPPHKTGCSLRDQQGTAGDAAKSKTWNPAQPSNPGTGSGSAPGQKNFWSRLGTFSGFRDQQKKRPGEPGRLGVFDRVGTYEPFGLI